MERSTLFQSVRRRPGRWLLVAAAAAGVMLYAAGASSQAREAGQSAAKAGTAVPAGGMKAYKDPATGQLLDYDPSGAPADAAQTGPNEPVSTVYRQDGTVGALLGPEHLSFTVVRKGPDGKLITECADGKKEAEALVSAPVSKATRGNSDVQ